MSAPAPRACVMGWPVKHSRSPLIHNYWLKQLSLPGSYERAEVEPGAFEAFLGDLSARGFCGGNVTLPHKEKAFLCALHKTDVALRLRAVNTLWFEAGDLWGDNTDVAGFLAGLDFETSDWAKNTKKAVVFGAGGAARAIIEALVQRNIDEINVVNRSLDRARELVRLFGSSVHAFSAQDAGRALNGSGLLVNTTSLGMAGQPPLDVDLALLSQDAIVYDIVYVPLETPLLKQAKSLNLRTLGGLSMLLHQAVPGFERWFGQRPIVTPDLRALIEDDVRRSSS